MKKSAEHLAWEKRLGRMADIASAWQQRMAAQPTLIDAGSSLAGDDATYPSINVSSLTSYSMAIAAEHLDFCLVALRETATLYPTAYLTVLRTSLMAASHAVWILAPAKRADRQLRALEFLADDLRSQLTMTKELSVTSDSMMAAKNEAVRSLQQRQGELQPIADQLRPGMKVNVWRLPHTEIITSVAKLVHDEDFLVGATKLIWRTGSSAAHGGRSFAVTHLSADKLVHSESGKTFARLTGDLTRDIGPAAATATLALNKAFELYDQRRQARRSPQVS